MAQALHAPAALLAVLRCADWLTAERARGWCRVLAALSLTVAIGWVALSRDGLDPLGKPLGTDFVSFWTASRLALAGHAAAAYDPLTHAAAQLALFPSAHDKYYAFFYPPVFLLLCLPVAVLPYLPSLLAWLAAGLVALLTCLRSLLPQPWAALPLLAFPAMLVNVGHGQNGFISAACFGGGMVLERRPFMAGLCLGALVFKPQLALGVPVALIPARRWRTMAGAATSALGLCALSWLILGGAAWRGFFHIAPLARTTLERGLVDPAKMQSMFAAVRLLHGGIGSPTRRN
ncbi:MAG: DUF2029 domain-containing protein [Pseudomonadota bacterium]|nr:DUF2029 domain-containing protein [Pseudomonadota bacterium]